MLRSLVIGLMLSAAAAESGELQNPSLSVATFGMGCYWQAKAKFLNISGIEHVKMGYMGGTVDEPSQDMLAVRDDTKHAEVVQVYYNPKVIVYESLLDIFWNGHEPWHEGRQGLNVGPQFQSVIFYHNRPQFTLAKASLSNMQEKPLTKWRRLGKQQNPRTELHSAKTFWPAKKAPGTVWAQYHCQGDRPLYTTLVKNFTSSHEESLMKAKQAAGAAGWDKEVRKSRILLKENRLRLWRERQVVEDLKKGLRKGGTETK